MSTLLNTSLKYLLTKTSFTTNNSSTKKSVKFKIENFAHNFFNDIQKGFV